MFRIIVINIGSTSTKLGFFLDQGPLFRETVDHRSEELSRLHTHDEWLEFHMAAVEKILEKENDTLGEIDIVVSRGGLTKPVEGGAYRVREDMLDDLRSGAYGWHPTNVGPEIAYRLSKRYGVEAVIYDAPATDEFVPLSRFSGLKGIERRSALHVLSQKSAARKAAQDLGIPMEEANFIVAHLGGGITIGAHSKGRIIDGTHGLSEGPFTPQRTGALPVLDLIDLCFSEGLSKEELKQKLFRQGGVYSYLKTHDMESVEALISDGNEEALLVVQAMAYQISKEICSMAAAFANQMNGVVLTGNLCRAQTLLAEIKERISFLGSVVVYPGEDELESLALGAYLVLTQAEHIKEYS